MEVAFKVKENRLKQAVIYWVISNRVQENKYELEISIIAPLTLVITSQVWKVTFSFSHLGISGQKHINTRWQTHCVSLYIYRGCSCALTCSPPLHLLSHMLGHTPLQVFPSFSSHTHGCRNKVRSSFRKQTNKQKNPSTLTQRLCINTGMDRRANKMIMCTCIKAIQVYAHVDDLLN